MTEPRADRSADATGRPARLTFRARVTMALLVSSLLPLIAFSLLLLVLDAVVPLGVDLAFTVLLVMAVVAVLAVPLSILLLSEVMRPLRSMLRSAERVGAGEVPAAVDAPGDDELAGLAQSHSRLAADLRRRSEQVGRMLEALARMSPDLGPEAVAERAADQAVRIFDLIEARVLFGAPSAVPVPEVVPGETRPLRAEMRVGKGELGVLLGWLPATRTWARPDQDLFQLFASEVAVALRNAELFERVESQNARLIELDASKDEFLRGVSHNLQSPLTSIRAHADQLRGQAPDPRLDIIAEQAERLSRMVRQLLTVTRLDLGALRPRSDVVSLATLTRKAWEALGAAGVPFSLEDRSDGWLAIADADQLDQVLWALLDNAVKHGGGKPVSVEIAVAEDRRRLRLTVADEGSGVTDEDRARLFGRFVRGGDREQTGGSGLGLFVSRELCRAMGGDLILEPARPGQGAAFTVELPAEHADEA